MNSIVLEVRVDARPETIFPLLTDPNRITSWIGTEASLDPRPGGVFDLLIGGEHRAWGRFVEVVEPEYVVFTFGWDGPDNPIRPGSTTVRIELLPEDDKTLVRLTHSGLPDAEAGEQHTAGWEHYLVRLGDTTSGKWVGPDTGPGGS